ncbi:MAG TPA: DNA-binding protein WhiA [Candidatus Binatus sp.]|nr:DNA-binding protein WhiA [Candidatus Binatus sp.]
MSETERDLVAALRGELAAIDPARSCDRAAERAGLRDATRRDDPVVGRLLLRLGRDGKAASAEPAAWEALPDHCRIAWLRGRFLGLGSLSLAAGRTHLEFVLPPGEAPVLAARLAELGLPASWRVRRGRGVVTWKSAETVTTFLARIGAGPGLLELEARQVARTLRGELNRVLNAESANVARSVSAAGRQIAAIDELAADGRLGEQPYLVRLVAAGRRETPEATISELADRLGVHRSAVQRALERLERLALHDVPRRHRGRPGREVLAPLA